VGKFKIKSLLSKKMAIILCVVSVVGIGAAVTVPKLLKSKLTSASVVTQKTAVAKTGNIKVTVSGSGTIYYKNTYEATATVASKIKKLYFKEGDTVKKGDLIAELDDSDAVKAFNSSRNNYLQNTFNNNQTIENVNKLTVEAPITGQVSNIQVKLGDKIAKGAKLFTLTDSSKLKLTAPFNSVDATKLAVGQNVEVYVTSFMQSVKGTVTFISNQSITTASGGQLTNVEVQVDNPGAITSGMKATIEAETASGTVASTDTGSFEYINQRIVTSEIDGTIKNLAVKDGQKITAGAVAVTLENDDVINSKQMAELKNQNLQSDLEDSKKKLEDYKIYADIDGVISEQKVKVGDTTKSGTVIATVTDTSGLYFDIPIDELDVAKLEVGQKATITIDAIEDTLKKPLTGEVSRIAFKGTSTNGVASFPVTVKLDAPNEKIKGGMNTNAEIAITDVQNVLTVPVEAVSKQGNKAYVWVKGGQGTGTTSNSSQTQNEQWQGGNNSGGGNSANRQNRTGNANRANGNTANNNAASNANRNIANNISIPGLNNNSSKNNAQSQQNYYAGAVRTEVQIGVNNAAYIEIKSGLKEGDVVVLPQVKTSSSTSSQGMGGGMGFPTGGNGGNFAPPAGAQGAGGRQ
jgi:HlyD family secretion protein